MRALTWHHITDGDETGVFETCKITQLFAVDDPIPVSNGIVLRARGTAPYYCTWPRSSHKALHPQHCHFHLRINNSKQSLACLYRLMEIFICVPAVTQTGLIFLLTESYNFLMATRHNLHYHLKKKVSKPTPFTCQKSTYI